MCRLCEKAGAPPGVFWYHDPRNFARNLYKRKKPGVKPKAFGEDPELAMIPLMKGAVSAKWDDPEHVDQKVQAMNQIDQFNQVLPLKDAMKAAEIAYPVGAMMCICRYQIRADEETNKYEYTCTGLGVGMFKWERWPERYRGGVHFMDASEAKEWLIKMDKMAASMLVAYATVTTLTA